MNRRIVRLFVLLALALTTSSLFAKQQENNASQSSSDESNATLPPAFQSDAGLGTPPESFGGDASIPDGSDPVVAGTNSRGESTNSNATQGSDLPHKLGPLTVSGNWRFRTEAWDWFQTTT